MRYRLAIIGCGAVFSQFQLPALKKLNKIPYLFCDTNIASAKKYAKKYNGEWSDNYLNHLDYFDMAILSVPHYLHCKIGVELLMNKKHLFIEKPLANTLTECDQIIKAKDINNKVVSVGLLRRYLDGTNWLKGLLNSGDLGDIVDFNFREGGIYSWPVETDSFWKRETAGGGVLMDTGAHTLDQMIYWLGDVNLIEYIDNSYGGVESDCFIKLITTSGAQGSVELSRTRNIGSYAIIKGKNASVKIGLVDNSIVTDPPELALEKYNGLIGKSCKPQSYVSLFKRQLDVWYDSIINDSENYISANSAKISVALIEKCYQNRRPWSMSWV
jgi:predicted dehydrogenase